MSQRVTLASLHYDSDDATNDRRDRHGKPTAKHNAQGTPGPRSAAGAGREGAAYREAEKRECNRKLNPTGGCMCEHAEKWNNSANGERDRRRESGLKRPRCHALRNAVLDADVRFDRFSYRYFVGYLARKPRIYPLKLQRYS